MDASRYEVPPDQLRRACTAELEAVGFASTAELGRLDSIIGQERATRAIEFGIDIPSYGYHIFAMGPVGVGKMTTVQRFLEQRAGTRPTPPDWCYVNNFANPDRPEAIELPPGKAIVFRKQMEDLVQRIQESIARAFSGEQYEEHRAQLIREIDDRKRQVLEEINQYANSQGFALVSTPGGLMVGVYEGGKVLIQEEYQALPEERRRQLEAMQPAVQAEMERRFRKVRALDDEARTRLQNLDREIGDFAIRHLFEPLKQEYEGIHDAQVFLDGVYRDVLDNLALFRSLAQPPEAGKEQSDPAAPQSRPQSPYDRYRVNVLVDNSQTRGAPVIVESTPTCRTLVGRIEYRAEFGTLVTDYSMIKAGALHRANGGYLVVEARKLLQDPLAWDCLKRALRDRKIAIQEIAQQFALLSTTSLEPEPIPLDVKVVLTGEPHIYYLLFELDPEFAKLFKVKADFAEEMDWAGENVMNYARFIATRCADEGLPHFTRDAVAKVVEYGARLVEDQQKLSTRFAFVADLVSEAAYWAQRSGHDLVQAEDVQRALDEKRYRSSQVEERIRESIMADILMITTDGLKVGQVNGLSVSYLGDYAFARPTRISCQTMLGREGVMNIDRESKLSGNIHDKGLLILERYLAGKFAKDRPLSLAASLCFEQTYTEVDGDSASAAELYVILSAVTGIPIRQGIAVTGSVNQYGEIQPIGAVNEKIEGFFEVCKARGLTGEQGVIIPSRNVRDLMLREDVVQAVREGKFHIWAVSTVDEGIGILTGVEAGERDEKGEYPPDSVNGRFLAQMEENERLMRRRWPVEAKALNWFQRMLNHVKKPPAAPEGKKPPEDGKPEGGKPEGE
ncbi:MAG: ATP-binding protein [Anaerolineae bacterium]|nr:ATP-binding protein [Anaerolineae bacterium]